MLKCSIIKSVFKYMLHVPSYKNMPLWQNGNKSESLLYVAHNAGHSLLATLS